MCCNAVGTILFLVTIPRDILIEAIVKGYAVGIVGDAGVRGTAQQPRLYVGMILILIFAEVDR